MAFIQAKVIYANEDFVGCTQNAIINSNEVVGSSIRTAYLYRNEFGYYMLTFTDPKVPSTLVGTWLVEGNQGLLLDGSLADVSNGLSSCCGSSPVVIVGPYATGFPPIIERSLATYTITRLDDGDIGAMQDFMLAYLDYAQPGTLQRTNYTTGTSTYTFSSYRDPALQGNDIQTGETARLFLSNTPAALTTGNKYSLEAFINGESAGTKVSGTTNGALSTLVTALTADATYGPLGTWSVVSGAIQLSTTTQDAVNLIVTQAV